MTETWSNIDPVEAESLLRGLRRRLAEIDDALQGQQSILKSNPESFAFQLSCESLLQVQARLNQELVELVRFRLNEIVSFALEGERFANHSASLGYVGVFFVRLQKLYSSVAQAIKTGPTLRGPIASDIRTATDLRLVDVYPASFGMMMYVPSHFDLLGNSVAADTLEALFALLSSTGDEQKVMRLSGEFGRRAFNHLRGVILLLKEVDATLKVDWTDYTGTKYNWVATPSRTARIMEFLNNITETRAEQKKLIGRLVGASLLKNRFELLLPDRSLVEGKFISGLGPSITSAFGAICDVTVDETEVHDRLSGDSKIYYSMRGIEKKE